MQFENSQHTQAVNDGRDPRDTSQKTSGAARQTTKDQLAVLATGIQGTLHTNASLAICKQTNNSRKLNLERWRPRKKRSVINGVIIPIINSLKNGVEL